MLARHTEQETEVREADQGTQLPARFHLSIFEN